MTTLHPGEYALSCLVPLHRVEHLLCLCLLPCHAIAHAYFSSLLLERVLLFLVTTTISGAISGGAIWGGADCLAQIACFCLPSPLYPPPAPGS